MVVQSSGPSVKGQSETLKQNCVCLDPLFSSSVQPCNGGELDVHEFVSQANFCEQQHSTTAAG